MTDVGMTADTALNNLIKNNSHTAETQSNKYVVKDERKKKRISS